MSFMDSSIEDNPPVSDCSDPIYESWTDTKWESYKLHAGA